MKLSVAALALLAAAPAAALVRSSTRMAAPRASSWQFRLDRALLDIDATPQVSGWGVYCYDFLLLPVAPSVSCSCLDAPYALRDINFRRLLPSPTVSQRLQPV